MQATGIIAEYNPFHNGHKWHLEEARRLSGCTAAIVVMSGNFVQRGEPALFDKWTRAEMAIRGGADLVLELPLVFAVRSAQFFATGAIRLLNSLGVVNSVCFGAEHPDMESLGRLAQAIDDRHTIHSLKQEMDSGQPYALSLAKALAKQTGVSPEIIAAPNNILAIEYLRAIFKYAPALKPIAVQRYHAAHHDSRIEGEIASATAIRSALQKELDIQSINQTVPATSAAVMAERLAQRRGPVFAEHLGQILLAKLRAAKLDQLASLPGISEGLHYKIKKSALMSGSLAELIDNVKSKRYARTRLQRSLTHFLLDIPEHHINHFDKTGPLYGRVLAFSQQGRDLLRQLTAGPLPLITKTTHFLSSNQRDQHQLSPLQTMLAFDTHASDIYSLLMNNTEHRRGGGDFRTTPLFIQ